MVLSQDSPDTAGRGADLLDQVPAVEIDADDETAAARICHGRIDQVCPERPDPSTGREVLECHGPAGDRENPVV